MEFGNPVKFVRLELLPDEIVFWDFAIFLSDEMFTKMQHKYLTNN
jgi:hypothetical protein